MAERGKYLRALSEFDTPRCLGSALGGAPEKPGAPGTFQHRRVRQEAFTVASAPTHHVMRTRSAESKGLGHQFSEDRSRLQSLSLQAFSTRASNRRGGGIQQSAFGVFVKLARGAGRLTAPRKTRSTGWIVHVILTVGSSGSQFGRQRRTTTVQF